jgi:single-strand DNA-binding protein
MVCKNRISLIGFLGQHAETHYISNGIAYARFSIAMSVSWKVKDTGEYNTHTEWHRIIGWNNSASGPPASRKARTSKSRGEFRYRDFTPADSDRSVRVAGIYASSILLLARSDGR